MLVLCCCIVHSKNIIQYCDIVQSTSINVIAEQSLYFVAVYIVHSTVAQCIVLVLCITQSASNICCWCIVPSALVFCCCCIVQQVSCIPECSLAIVSSNNYSPQVNSIVKIYSFCLITLNFYYCKVKIIVVKYASHTQPCNYLQRFSYCTVEQNSTTVSAHLLDSQLSDTCFLIHVLLLVVWSHLAASFSDPYGYQLYAVYDCQLSDLQYIPNPYTSTQLLDS